MLSEKRLGRLTASRAYIFLGTNDPNMAYEKGDARGYKQINDLALDLAFERVYGKPSPDREKSNSHTSEAIQHGVDTEEESINHFLENRKNKHVKFLRGQEFYIHPDPKYSKFCGATPDSISRCGNFIIETKSTLQPHIQAKRIIAKSNFHDDPNGALKSCEYKYYWQTQYQMWNTGSSSCIFLSYCKVDEEANRQLVLWIKRDERDIQFIEARVTGMINLIKRYIEEIKDVPLKDYIPRTTCPKEFKEVGY